MDLKKIIKHHRDEAEHTRRLHAHVAAEFHTKAAQALEDVERRLAEAIAQQHTPRTETIYCCATGVEMPAFEPCKEMKSQTDI